MTHREHKSLGLTLWDDVLIAALVVVLALGLVLARWLASTKRAERAAPLSIAAQAVPTEPAPAPAGAGLVAPTSPPVTPAAATEPAASPSGQPSLEAPPPPPATMTAGATSTLAPSRQEQREMSPQPSPEIGGGSPTITPSATLKSPAASGPKATPLPATVVYVRSAGQTHALGMVTSGGDLIDDKFHAYAGAPAWSPDGKTIAFFGEIDIRQLGGVYKNGEGLWSIGVDGTNPKRLFGIDRVHNTAWSPDGTRLAFEIEGSQAFANEVIIADPEGKERSRFNGEQPAWTPDSRELVIKACNPGCGLWRVSLKGAYAARLTSDQSDSFPALSPDGKYMAFSSNRDGDWEIYLLRLDTMALMRLTKRVGVDTTPVFSRNGQNIYLRTNAFGDWRITVMALDGSNEQVVLADVGPSDDWGAARPAVY
jgi:TolB protein